LQLRAFLVLPHLVHRRLPDVDVSEFGAMRGGQALVSGAQCHQHERSPFLLRRRPAACAASVARAAGRAAFASRPTDWAKAGKMLSGAGRMRRPESTAIETLRDAEELEESSRITSSTRRDSVAFKCRANGISVRTLTRGGSSCLLSAGGDAWPRSVQEIRIERLRPSGNATTTKAGPRPERSGKTVNRWPKSECRESVTVVTHPSRSRIVSFCDVR
jgi:hypothetical protein